MFTLAVAGGLAPADFGAWALFVTLVGYAPNVLFGVGNGMNRAIPIHLGRGDLTEAERIESAAWAVVGLVTLLALPLALVLAASGQPMWVPVAVFAGTATAIYQVQQFAFRSRLDFTSASAQQWLSAAATVVVFGWLVVFSDRSLAAATGGWTAAAIFAVAAGFLLRRPRLADPTRVRALRLIAMGFPIMVSGLLGTLFYTADRWVASIRLDPTDAGSYGLASLIASAVFLVPMVIAQQQYPRLAFLHGAAASVDALGAMARRQSIVAAAASIAMGCGAAVFVALFVLRFLPAYDAGALVVILSAGVAALAGATGFGNLLVVVGALWTYLGTQLVAFVVALAAMWVGSAAGGVGIALGLVSGQVFLLLLMVWTTRRTIRMMAAS